MSHDGELYRDRYDAGRVLASCLENMYLGADPLVLAVPRGGVPIAVHAARVLRAPLDLFLVRKLGVPGQAEWAMGAITSGGMRLLDERLIADEGVSPAEVEAATEQENKELLRQAHAYRTADRRVDFSKRSVVLIDDGLATGYTLRVATAALRQAGCPRITVAVPVGARAGCASLAPDVDLLVCPVRPEIFRSVSYWYEDFPPVGDEEIHACLENQSFDQRIET